MARDYKKEEKALYQPKPQPSIIEVPRMKYIGMSGTGNPNDENGPYKEAIGLLYGVSYTLKMSHRNGYEIDGFEDYVVPPLEGFWEQEGIKGFDIDRKDLFSWLMVIRIPEFIQSKHLEWAKETLKTKKKLDATAIQYIEIEEGLCVQMMHIGPFDTEIESVNKMDQYLIEQGYESDFTDVRKHHEIYLSDIRKVDINKWKTIIRHPIKKIN